MLNKNNLERDVIFLSALLHDIGKFVQRAQKDPRSNKHTVFGAEWIQNSGLAELLNEFFNDTKPTQEIISKVNCHHDEEKYISLADSISAGMDRIRIDDEEEREPSVYRLLSIFSEIELLYESKEKKYYKLAALGEDCNSWLSETFPINEQFCSYEEYRKLLENFNNKLKSLKGLKGNRFIERLYFLLQKYTWCIPSAVYKNEPDVSLFDHLKTTAAIAVCLYEHDKSHDRREQPFLLVGGDISGIQNFIYKITHTPAAPGVSKRLRGRSFYLSLISDVISKKIVHDLNLYLVNIIYCSGGRFEILLPNTKETEDKIEGIRKNVNDWLFKNFSGELGLILERLPLSTKELKNYAECSLRLEDKISVAKKCKFKEFLFSAGYDRDKGNKIQNIGISICKSCNFNLIQKEKVICEFCDEHRRIGEILPRTKAIVYAKNNINFDPVDAHLVDFKTIGKIYLVSNLDALKKYVYDEKNENIISIELINSTTEDFGGFTFIGNTVPTAKEDFKTTNEYEEFKYEKGEVLSFETIAELSIGDKHLGLLKMDVDRLGLIFSKGLKNKSISRIATLSRMLNLYFTGYINNACENIFKTWLNESNSRYKEKINQIFYIVYSGGDDLLVIGPASEIPKLALEIRNKFKEYTCNNDDIDVSAGVLLIRPKFPIGTAALLCGKMLSKSKKSIANELESRKRITVFGETVLWQKKAQTPGFSELLEFAEKLYEYVVNKKLPRGFLYKLIRLNQQYIKENKINCNYLPQLGYQIKRNIKEENLRNILKEKLVTSTDAIYLFKNIRIPAIYALLKSRKEE